MNRTMIMAEIVTAENVHHDWVFTQWLDFSTIRLCKHSILCDTKSLNPAIEEMNAEMRERRL